VFPAEEQLPAERGAVELPSGEAHAAPIGRRPRP
jgi:hypothetical protein